MFLLTWRLLYYVNLIKRHGLMLTKLTANSCLPHLVLVLVRGWVGLVHRGSATTTSKKSLIIEVTEAAVRFRSLLLHSLLVDIFCIWLHSHVRHISVSIHSCNTVCLLFENLVQIWLFAWLVSSLHHEVVLILPMRHLLIVHVDVLTRCERSVTTYSITLTAKLSYLVVPCVRKCNIIGSNIERHSWMHLPFRGCLLSSQLQCVRSRLATNAPFDAGR